MTETPFDALPADFQAAITAAGIVRHYGRNDVLMAQGAFEDSLHLIQRGRFLAQTTTPDGDLAGLTIMGPGEFVGELALVDPDQPRSVTVVSLEPRARTLAIRRSEYERLASDGPALDKILLRILTDRTRRLTQQALDAAFVPASTRVYRAIVRAAPAYDRRPTDGAIAITLHQEHLAALAMTTRPTVSTVLRPLKDDGVVSTGRGAVYVHDLDAIEELAQLG